MVLWRLKSCPKCVGDVFTTIDMDGYRRDLKALDEFERQPTSAGGTRAKQ